MPRLAEQPEGVGKWEAARPTETIATQEKSMRLYLGHHVLGFAAILFGVIALVWRDFNAPWQQIQILNSIPYHGVLVYVAAAAEIFGGIAIQWDQTKRLGAIVLGGVFLFFALMWVPHIFADPRHYDRYGNFFEQFSIFSGALIVFATTGRTNSPQAKNLAQVGYVCFAICVISFTLEQLFYLSATAEYVPKWIPPGQMFWAVLTTIAFALAAIALLLNFLALLASRLLTAMIVAFGLLIWLPAPFADPHKLINWAGNAQNLAIGAAAWIVTDFLTQTRTLKTKTA